MDKVFSTESITKGRTLHIIMPTDYYTLTTMVTDLIVLTEHTDFGVRAGAVALSQGCCVSACNIVSS